jgi:hypothetical protein
LTADLLVEPGRVVDLAVRDSLYVDNPLSPAGGSTRNSLSA